MRAFFRLLLPDESKHVEESAFQDVDGCVRLQRANNRDRYLNLLVEMAEAFDQKTREKKRKYYVDCARCCAIQGSDDIARKVRKCTKENERPLRLAQCREILTDDYPRVEPW